MRKIEAKKKRIVIPMSRKLTVKQQKFVQYYLANGGNGTEAARKAGYKGSEKTLSQVAIENLGKPGISKLIGIEQEKLKESTGATAKAKRELLWKIAQHNSACKQADKEDSSGEVKMLDPKAAISAITELNKMDGDHASTKIEDVTPRVNPNPTLTQEQALALLEKYDLAP